MQRLLALLGAFLISRLLNNQSSFSRNRARTRELLREGDSLTDSAGYRRFRWYNERTLESCLNLIDWDLTNRGAEGQKPLSPDEYYEKFDFSPYLTRRQTVQEIERYLEKKQEESKKAQTKQLWMTLIPKGPDPAFTVAARQSLHEEGEAIAQLVLRIKDHIREVREHLDTVSSQPERSGAIRLVLAAILVLFLVGVIFPLSYLPVRTGSAPSLSTGHLFDFSSPVRTLVLVIAAIVFASLVIALTVQNERLLHPASDLSALKARLEAGSYSDYLRVRLENGIPL